jgi:hypothetical protein
MLCLCDRLSLDFPKRIDSYFNAKVVRIRRVHVNAVASAIRGQEAFHLEFGRERDCRRIRGRS